MQIYMHQMFFKVNVVKKVQKYKKDMEMKKK